MPCALVLSAGGMFGAYQAGAWNVLSQRFQPDIVVGTSVGALNGWAIAGGCSAAALVAMWRDPATAGAMRLRVPLLPWNGWIDPAGLLRQVEDWYVRFPPRVPYSATVVQVPQLRLVRVPGERITPLHLMASCAIPFGYPPVRINGRLYVDGGLLDVLPVWAAAEMGATRVIAVNVLPQMPTRALRTVVRAVRFFGQKPTAAPGLEVLRVSPRAPLGTVREALTWNAENVERWIRQGEDDARGLDERLQSSGS
jgi:NTE family protein